eukprot:scaffold87209_cov35-Cyclotella_meneghiniana.AAC.2
MSVPLSLEKLNTWSRTKRGVIVMLELFWTYVQKIFELSTAAQDEFTIATQTKYPKHSETRRLRNRSDLDF